MAIRGPMCFESPLLLPRPPLMLSFLPFGFVVLIPLRTSGKILWSFLKKDIIKSITKSLRYGQILVNPFKYL